MHSVTHSFLEYIEKCTFMGHTKCIHECISQNIFSEIYPREYILNISLQVQKYNTFANVFANVLQVLNMRVVRTTLMY